MKVAYAIGGQKKSRMRSRADYYIPIRTFERDILFLYCC